MYFLEYRPRKCLTIKRWEEGERRYCLDKNGKRKATKHLSVKLWDVWGFFQGSFNEALDKWLPGDPDKEFIRRMKGERSTFDRAELDDIKRYNAAELRCLVKIMEALRSALNDMGVKLTRWDGAGAIAAALLREHKMKEHKGASPPDVFMAARRAYSGGHIESCMVGRREGELHHVDINSAYPRHIVELPSLASGRWERGTGEPPADGFCLVECRWQLPQGRPFYPLFYRTETGAVLYPPSGEGTYWLPEFRAAQAWRDKLGGTVEPLRWYLWKPDSQVKPFAWVGELYESRLADIEAGRHGPEKPKKLGYNSIYGKLAQQLGWSIDADGNLKIPPYFQLEWAGAVTAGCRAQMMMAALLDPWAVVGFATDGLFTIRHLAQLHTPKRKELGAWDYKRHDGITMVMPGVYWLHDGEKRKGFSRGFDKREMSDAEFVWEAWRKGQDFIPVKLSRLIGLGSALASEQFWAMRGRFMTTTRTLALNGDNSKRYAINVRRSKPHLQLVDTIPKDHELPELLGVPVSAPYPIEWLDGRADIDELEGELADEREALDAALA